MLGLQAHTAMPSYALISASAQAYSLDVVVSFYADLLLFILYLLGVVISLQIILIVIRFSLEQASYLIKNQKEYYKSYF